MTGSPRPLLEVNIPLYICFFLSQSKTRFFYTLFWYCNKVSHLRLGLPLSWELMVTHHVLLMNMLFLGSMLMIIIVTNLAWEPVSQDLYPWLHSSSIILPRDLAWNPFSLVNLVAKLSLHVCLGKGFGGTFTTWGIIFIFSRSQLKII